MLMSAYVHQTLTVLKINPRTLSVCVGGSCWDYLFLFREEPNLSGIAGLS